MGDGGLGFWKALTKVYGATRHQRCWVHKPVPDTDPGTANVLNKLPKSSQAKAALQAIWMADTRGRAEAAFDAFIAAYGDKYPKATECLAKDREQLLASYDFPAPHWQSIRTTNPIESTFATVHLRTAKTRGCLSRATILATVLQLAQSAQKRWRRLRGYRWLPRLVEGARFQDGVEITKAGEEASRSVA